jgi:hypothetical protein
MTYKLISLFFFIVFVVACSGSRYSRELKQALHFAGSNRPELEKVLEHYKNDALKRKAAEFLITNMPGHFSYKYPELLQAYYDELYHAVDTAFDNETNKQIIEQISEKHRNIRGIFETVCDSHVITSDFLIDNIDRAFDVWQNGEWALHVSFDDFLEYILPYKGNQLQPLDNWREYAREMLKGDIDDLHYCDLYKNLAFQAATSVSKEIILLNRMENPPGGVNAIPILDLRTIEQMPFGSCADHAFLALSVMRSKGIPVMEDFTPQWSFQASSHSWNILLNNTGKNVVFSAGSSNPGEPHKPYERMAKVFRRGYAINNDIFSIRRSEQFIPAAFRNFFIKDVTDEYMTADDVEIEIPRAFRRKYKYAYLAVFDNRNWIPIQYGKVKGSKVRFPKMGRGSMYLPVFYDETGVVPFSAPFYISPAGEIQAYQIDNTQTEDMHIYRKYFIGKHCYDVGNRMRGGRFEAANRPDFSDAVLIHRIPNFTVQSGQARADNIDTPYRYWRYYSADSCHNNVAELYFFQSGNEQAIRGKIIGTEGSYSNNPQLTREAAFDDDPLTFFDAPDPSGGWVGMDFGEPIRLSHISYTPRGDGNDVTPGDTHELLYRDGDRWVSLGTRVANDIVMVYENVPKNTIYWFRNHSRGKEERIFTYENGRQVFW